MGRLVRIAVMTSAFVFGILVHAGLSQVLECGGVGGVVREHAVMIPQRGSRITLQAKLFAPDSSRQILPCPGISMLPGGGAPISSVEWAARRLAAHGYVVIITKPARGASVVSYDAAAKSGIDFLLSDANPFRSGTAGDRIGVAGWSLGARALSKTQEEDVRVKALVAWDNLAVSETGDAGSPSCNNSPAIVRVPRVPAMGQASEYCTGRPADVKKSAFEHWKKAEQPVMQIVFKSSTHFWWGAQAAEARHDLIYYYTQNWFDRWLKGDSAAAGRLLSRRIEGRPLENILSSTFRSAASFDGYDCADLLTGCR
jgi:dienelactone hydrolase